MKFRSILLLGACFLPLESAFAQDGGNLAERLLKAANQEKLAQILEQAPGSSLPEVLAACRKAAQAHLDHREHPEALAAFQVVLAVAQKLDSPAAMGAAYRGVGLSYWRLGRASDALANYRKGLEFATLAKDQAMAAELLRGMGVTERSLGDFSSAIEADLQSIAIYRELGNQHLIAAGLNNLAANYWRMGDLRRANQYHEQALRLGSAYPDVADAATMNMGVVAVSAGDLAVARTYLEKSLRYNEEIHDDRAIALVLTNLGPVYRAAGQFDLAITTYDRALKLARTIHDANVEEAILINRAAVHMERKETSLAAADLEQSLRLAEEGQSPFVESVSLSNLAHIENSLGHTGKAIEEADRAVAIGRQLGSPELLWQSLDATANCEVKRGRRLEARTAFEESIAQVESWRMQLSAGETENQSFLGEHIAPYHGLLRLLLEDGSPADALAVAEKAKARQLLDVLAHGKVQVTAALTAEERAGEERLDRVASEWNRRLAQAPNPAARAEVRASWEHAANALAGFRAQLYAAHPELPVKRGEAAPISLAGMDPLLPEGAALVEFTVSEDSVYVFLVARGTDGQPSIKAHAITWDRSGLAREVDDFRRQLASRDLSYRRAAAQLYQRLLGTFESELKSHATLVIVPDGPLWNLPFQAMVVPGGHHLLERQAIFYAPSLTFLSETRRIRHGTGDAQLFAISSSRPGDLPYTADEVRAVARLYDAGKALTLSGDAAARRGWKTDAARYGILHFAAHAELNSANPMYSYLQFTSEPGAGDGILEAREIVNLDLHAQVAILSACETARGQPLYGEGQLGMSWAFLLAGVPTTVVSQWKVDSGSTAALMPVFHRFLKPALDQEKSGLGRANALRQAALAVMRSPGHLHPFYWAGFVVVGNGY
ncbi:MAG TPA: CHAT domain-containing tetratricopeptide repeat protein [Bryobacteraceae bacterium]|nr:CHAT domain-containing tetratricopeptide repeat protein [Bryobacteraceae bacterium]